MEVRINKKGCEAEIRGEMGWVEFEKYFERALKELSQELELKGFRKGQAPLAVAQKAIGDDKILARAAQIAINEAYVEVLEKENLEPLTAPQADVLKLAKANPFVFRLKTEIAPKIELPDYREIAKGLKKEEVKVEDREIEDALLWLRKSRAKFNELNRPAQKGDFVEIKYQSPALENNKQFEDGFILGKGQMAKGFEDELIGMQKGERKEFSLIFPADYFRQELADKKAGFKVKMEKTAEMILPALNDDFAKALGRFNNLEDLKSNLRQGLILEKEGAAEQKRAESILKEISQKTDFPLPEFLVNFEYEKALKAVKPETDKEKQQLKEISQEQIKQMLILRAIGKKEQIKVSDAEAEQAAKGFLKSYPQPDKIKQIDPIQLRDYYKGIIFEQKTIEKICR